MSTFLFKTLFVFLSFITATYAAQLPGNIALHIAKSHYQHPVHLVHPYLDVWHMKGPLAEKVANASLQNHFSFQVLNLKSKRLKKN